MCIYHFMEQLNRLLDIGTFAVAAGTLLIAWKIYKNFDVKKQYLNQQLSAVNELASAISKTQVRFSFYYKGKPPESEPDWEVPYAHSSYPLNFFSPTNFWDTKKYPKVFIRGNYLNQVFPFIEYRHNPLLPSKIANRLNDLYESIEYTLPIQEQDMPNHYILLSAIGLSKDEYSMAGHIYKYKDSVALKNEAEYLRKEIIDWLKDYGAEDVNF